MVHGNMSCTTILDDMLCSVILGDISFTMAHNNEGTVLCYAVMYNVI